MIVAKIMFKTTDHFPCEYRRDPNKSGGGTQLLHAPPTAHMVQSIFSFAVAVDTLGGYNWRHRGDFSISTYNPPNRPILYQNLREKKNRFLGFRGGLRGFKVEIKKIATVAPFLST